MYGFNFKCYAGACAYAVLANTGLETVVGTAAAAFDELGVKKLPSVAQPNAEFSELSAQRKAQYEDYCKAKTNMIEWAATKKIWREFFG